MDAVAPLGSRSQSKEFLRGQVPDELAISFGGRVMEFVDDYNVERIGCEVIQLFRRERLDAGKNVLPFLRFVLAYKEFTK